METLAGLFPGQGSQSVGMGKDFYEQSELAKELFNAADKALGFSLSTLCMDGPIEELTLTQHAQPALLVVSHISHELFKEKGLSIAAAAGHSLGEYSALVAAGAIDFIDAVQLVHKRGLYMQEAVPKGEGAMLAVMGPTEEKIQAVIDCLENGIVEIANLNSPGQIVVAGDVGGIEEFAKVLKSEGAKVIPLKVSAPFHCSLMEPAAEKLAVDLDATTFSDPKIPVIANVSARPVVSGMDARELLKKQVCSSVRWTDSILALAGETASSGIIEFGPGGVLSKLVKRIDPSLSRHTVYDTESLAKTAEALA